MTKFLQTIFVLLCVVVQAQAQAQNISGRVIDSETKAGLPGVSVYLKGTTRGTITDNEGKYNINAASGQTLVFQYIGYVLQEVAVGSSNTMDVELTADTKQLGEVVVVGYGSIDRRELTSSVARVSAETIEGLPVAGIDQALQGRAAGVQITTNSGTPGGGISVRVRGSGSISASNQPLYVIDGVPMISGDASQLGFGGQSMNVLNDLNPADIESIEILKDAAAASIYGSRAANGVVLITTKRGKSGKNQVNFNTYVGTSTVWRKPKFLNTQQYVELGSEALGLPQGASVQDFWGDYYGGNYPFPQGTDTDWVDQVLRTATIQNYELNTSGGNDRTTYYLSGSYFDQEGLVINSRFRRFSTRLNLDHKLSDKFSISTSAQLAYSVNNRIVSDNTLYGPFANALAASPLWPVRDARGQYTRPQNFYTNPVAEGTENDDLGKSYRAIANITANYRILPNLILMGRAAADLNYYNERRYTPDNYPGSSSAPTGGSGVSGTSTQLQWVIEATLNYQFNLGEKHQFNTLVGHSRQYNARNTNQVVGIVFPGERFRYVSSAATVNAGGNAEDFWGLESYFGRLNYAFADKYLFSFNFRADAASRFSSNNRWGFFPGVSAGWRVKQESFLQNANFISELKLRASYGSTGNWEIGNFSWRYLYGGTSYLDQAGILQTQIGNSNLTWEKNRQFDVGLDLGLFKDRVKLTADYYIRRTDDLLFNRPIPSQTGFTSYASNIGAVENRGLELVLSTVNFDGKQGGFRWSTDLNISFNRNKVLELYRSQDVLLGFGGNSIILREGEPIGSFYGLIADGVYSRTDDVPTERRALGIQGGDMNYRDINGDGVITDSDFTIIGNAQPKFFGGLTNTFSYKGFDLTIFLQFTYGNKTWNAAGNFQQGMFANFFDDNQTEAVTRRWRQEGDVTDVPRATTDVSVNRNNQSNTTRFVEDGSFLRVKNLTLGYNFQPDVLKRIKLRSLRLYLQTQNLLTFTNYSGFDPEVNFAGTSNTTLGTDFYTFPQPRTITFGINIGL